MTSSASIYQPLTSLPEKLQHLDTYFPRRNNIQFTPQENVNYTPETIQYAASAAVANRIRDLIVDQQRRLNNLPFDIYDATAGIGGMSLSFLDSPDIRHVYSYEINPERRQLLKNNVESYQFQDKWTQCEEFKGIPGSAFGAVVSMDVPWLPENVSGLSYTKDQYILENITFAGLRLEDWLPKLTMAAVVAFRLPPGYKFQQVPGWKIELNDNVNRKKNTWMIFAINLNYPKMRNNTATVGVCNASSNESIVTQPTLLPFVQAPESIYKATGQTAKVATPPSKQSASQSAYQSVPQQRPQYQNQQGQQRPQYNPLRRTNKQYQPQNKPIPVSPNANVPNLQLQSYKPPAEAIVTKSSQILSEYKEASAGSSSTGIIGLYNYTPSNTVVEAVQILTPKVWTPEDIQSWDQNLRLFLHQTLYNLTQDLILVQQLLSPENYEIWKMAFTEETYSSTNNYDVLENLGDTVIEMTFVQYLQDRFAAEIREGKINEQGISSLKIEYMSKVKQAQFSNQLGLPKHLLVDPNVSINIHMIEDVFEAFFGALLRTANSIKMGLGYILSYNLVVQLYNNIQINSIYISNPAETQIHQLFKSLGWGSTAKIDRIVPKNPGEKYKYILSLTPTAEEFMLRQKINVPRIFGIGEADTNKSAEAYAFSNGLETLYKAGITNDWLENQKFLREFNATISPEYAPYLEKLYQRMREDGYIRVFFEVPKVTKNSTVKILQLKGVKAGYQRSFLLGTEVITGREYGVTTANLSLIQKYVG